jgi:starch synthase
MSKLKILYVSPEVTPFAKVGGLADVAGSLPGALKDLDCDIRLIMPKYQSIDLKKYKLSLLKESITVGTGFRYYFPQVYSGKLGKKQAPIYFIQEESSFGRERIYNYSDDCVRFCFFDKTCLELCKHLDFKPDIIHINDWHTSLIPVFLKTIYKKDPFFAEVRTLMSIHNIQYQGITSLDILKCAQINRDDLPSLLCDTKDGDVDFMFEGIANADFVSTVSQTYAEEILTPQYGAGMEGLLMQKKDRLFGIINGIDTDLWNPEKDKLIPKNFSVNTLNHKQKNKLSLQELVQLPLSKKTPLIGMVSRIAGQKGFDILLMCLEMILEAQAIQFVILGTGDKWVEEQLQKIAAKYPDQFKVILKFDEITAHQIYAGSDFFLMPSQFEPCGLGQMIAMRYGTIPIVRKTGGLTDTVDPYLDFVNFGDGFVFEKYDFYKLAEIIKKAIEIFNNNPNLITSMRQRIMRKDFSWNNSAKLYLDLYQKMLKLPPEDSANFKCYK